MFLRVIVFKGSKLVKEKSDFAWNVISSGDWFMIKNVLCVLIWSARKKMYMYAFWYIKFNVKYGAKRIIHKLVIQTI